jgi:hypothetical protein
MNELGYILAGVVADFVKEGATRSERVFRQKDFELLDDPIELPKGKLVQVTFEYIDDKEEI